jgi:hypothetical protein
MSTIGEHIATIRAELEELSDEHSECGNEWLAITEAEKAVDEIEKVMNQRIGKE